MIEQRRVLGIIAARGGSKGLPGKNVADLGGRPVVAWSVQAARESQYLDRAILSSDDATIISAAQNVGCDVPFVRPAELSTDESSIYDVIYHALDQLDEVFDLVVLLQASSPLRRAQDIDDCIALCHRRRAPAAFSISTTKPVEWMFTLGSDDKIMPVLGWSGNASRRQDLPTTYLPNGAVYVAETTWLRDHAVFASPSSVAFVMPAERSVDIDTAVDLALCRALVNI